jgi:hypothetical protein
VGNLTVHRENFLKTLGSKIPFSGFLFSVPSFISSSVPSFAFPSFPFSTKSSYDTLLEEEYDKLQVYMNDDESEWFTIGTQKNISVYRRKEALPNFRGKSAVSDQKYPIVKASIIVKAEPNVLSNLLLDSDAVPKYNPYCSERRELGKVPGNGKIVHTKTTNPFFPRSYDFVTLMQKKITKDKIYVFSRAIKHPDTETVEKGFIRSEVLFGATIIEPLGKKKSIITTYDQKKYCGIPLMFACKTLVPGTSGYLDRFRAYTEGMDEKSKNKYKKP